MQNIDHDRQAYQFSILCESCNLFKNRLKPPSSTPGHRWLLHPYQTCVQQVPSHFVHPNHDRCHSAPCRALGSSAQIHRMLWNRLTSIDDKRSRYRISLDVSRMLPALSPDFLNSLMVSLLLPLLKILPLYLLVCLSCPRYRTVL